jgi:PKD repeat protein
MPPHPEEHIVRRFAAIASAATLAVTCLTTTGLASAPSASASTQVHTAIVSDDPANWTPNVLDGAVKAVVQVGSTMYVSGTFTQVQAAGGVGPVLTRNRIFAFDASTGQISDTFVPSFDAEVTALAVAPDGKTLYAGGVFNTINGVNARKLVRIDAATGAKVTSFKPAALNGKVNDLKLTNGRLFVAGSFTTVGSITRPALASLSPATGALTSEVTAVFAGTQNGGSTAITKFEVNPAGTRLLAIGNFATVDGLDRRQVVMLDTSVSPAVVADWQTNFYKSTCAAAFDSYMRDLDISPDGSYAVISTTGAYRGADSACDVISRWDMNATGSDLKATWRNYTGGDTTYAVAITGGVVYVGGHFRWVNNAYASDTAGPGAVPREGIAALDPVNGLPFSWNPGRTRGVGVFDLLATPAGLWVGSDTDRIANELRQRIAFMPLSKGKPIPASRTGVLPSDVYLVGSTPAADPSVLFRVNAGGPELASADDGPNWLADTSSTSPYHNTGSVTATYPAVPAVDSTVPNSDTDRAPRAIFDSQRTDPSALPEMAWAFTVPSGKPLTVRLYFADRNGATKTSGKRRFAVDVDGVNKLNLFDLNVTPGHDTGTMRAFDLTSDGRVDIAFRHQTNDPLVSAIEIVDRSVSDNDTSAADAVRKQAFSGSGTPGAASSLTTSAAWNRSRGSVLIDGTVYSGWSDGTFQARAFDGTTFGAASSVDLYNGTFANDIASMTGLAYTDGRLYYTLFGDPKLYYRYFTSESRVVGTTRLEATGDLAALAPQRVNGMFLSGSTLYVADRNDGRLYSVNLTAGTVTGPATLVDASTDWRTRGAFVWNGPTARASVTSCAANTCSFDASASTSSVGSISGYSWTFGDGSTGTGATPSHSYAAGGAFTATVTVTDDQGATSTASVLVTPGDPVDLAPTASFTVQCTLLSCAFDGSGSSDPEGAVASYRWDFGDGTTVTTTTATTSHDYAGAADLTVSLVVTDSRGQASPAATQQVSVAPAPQSPVGFRASATASANLTNHKVTVPSDVNEGDALLLFVTANSLQDVVSPPTGWDLAGTQAAAEERTFLYTKVASAADAGKVQVVSFAASTKADLTVLAYSGTSATPFEAVASAAETVSRTTHTTPGATVTTPGAWVVSYWADKSSATTSWTTPADLTGRTASTGAGSGRITSVTADTAQGTPAGVVPGSTATADAASAKATMWTVVLKPA